MDRPDLLKQKKMRRLSVNEKEVFMGINLNEMPKLGFGLMRLPEKDGAIDLQQVNSMVDYYMKMEKHYSGAP